MMSKDNYPICPICGTRGDCNECCQRIFDEETREDDAQDTRGMFL